MSMEYCIFWAIVMLIVAAPLWCYARQIAESLRELVVLMKDGPC